LFAKSELHLSYRGNNFQLVVLLVAVALLYASGRAFGQIGVDNSPIARRSGPIQQANKKSAALKREQMLIRPGARVGPLALGGTWAHALELFPSKAQDQKWEDSCGMTFNWTDEMGSGNIFIRFNNQRVFQIESATTRFHTIEGVTVYDSPEKVERYYKNLRAFVLLGDPIRALGDRPLVFWVDSKKGIAFVFAFYPTEHRRYLYKIIVFRPNTNLCPEEETTDSPNWQELAPYSLEPPDKVTEELPTSSPIRRAQMMSARR